MSAEQQTCWVLACDACRTHLQDPDEDYTLHFDTLDAATDYALTVGWQLDTDGHAWCHRCVAIAVCLTDGHDYTPWMPCACNGTHPDHALWGCGLLRYCQRHGCDAAETATLATLPTTDEPTTPGR